MSKIDRDRGALIRKHPSGYRVVMYVDTPGVYFDEDGNKVDRALAEEAGFEVASDLKTRAKNKLRKNYERQIGAKFAEAEDAIEELLEQNPDIIDELTVEELDGGNWGVVDGNGNAITDARLTKDEAITLWEGITGEDFVSDADDTPEATNPFLEMESKEIRAMLKEAKVKVPTGMRMPKLAEFANENLELEDEGSDLIE